MNRLPYFNVPPPVPGTNFQPVSVTTLYLLQLYLHVDLNYRLFHHHRITQQLHRQTFHRTGLVLIQMLAMDGNEAETGTISIITLHHIQHLNNRITRDITITIGL